MLKLVGVAFGVAAVIGGTIGMGIMRTPGPVAALLPDPFWCLAAWIGIGIFMAIGANSLAELATAFPRAGGPYVYSRRAFGDYTGFATGWADWANGVIAMSFMAVGIGDFAGQLVPALSGYTPWVACLMLIGVTAVNWIGLRAGAGAQQLMSLLKVLAFCFLILAFLVVTPAPDPSPAAHPPAALMGAGGAITFVSAMLALQMVHETSLGWNSGVYFSEEDQAPSRNVPRALFVGVLAIVVIYVLVNVGLLRVLGIDGMARSQVAVADAAQRVFGGSSDKIVAAVAIVSLIGILNITLMFTLRVLFALSRDGFLAASVSRVSEGGTPRVALVLTSVAALPFAFGVDFETLFGIAAFCGVAVNMTTYVAVIALRIREPGLHRPYRAWGYPWLPALAVLVSIGLLAGFVISAPKTSLSAIVAIAVSYPVFRWFQRSRHPATGTAQ